MELSVIFPEKFWKIMVEIWCLTVTVSKVFFLSQQSGKSGSHHQRNGNRGALVRTSSRCGFLVSTHFVLLGRSHRVLFNSWSFINHVQVFHLDFQPQKFQFFSSVPISNNGDVFRFNGIANENEYASAIPFHNYRSFGWFTI